MNRPSSIPSKELSAKMSIFVLAGNLLLSNIVFVRVMKVWSTVVCESTGWVWSTSQHRLAPHLAPIRSAFQLSILNMFIKRKNMALQTRFPLFISSSSVISRPSNPFSYICFSSIKFKCVFITKKICTSEIKNYIINGTNCQAVTFHENSQKRERQWLSKNCLTL